MSKDQKLPIFLERRSYRQRRMMDAVRLLPLVGLSLWLVPTLWGGSTGDDIAPVKMSQVITYVFSVWMSLIVIGGVLWHYLVDASLGDASATPDDAGKIDLSDTK